MPSESKKKPRRGSRERLRKARAEGSTSSITAIGPGLAGGSYKPFTPAELKQLHEASLHILEHFGISEPTDAWRERIVAAGGWMNEHERLCFPPALVEDTIAKAARNFVLPGREEKHDLDLSGTKTYYASSTAAIRILDPETGEYRHTTLKDLYDMVRLADALENVHFVQRPLIARDVADDVELDVNTAYLTTAATTKPIITTVFQPETLKKMVALYDLSVGGDGSGDAYRKRPFASTTCSVVVSPLRFSQESLKVADMAVQLGMPLKVSTVPQAGATGPVTLAGTIALGNAETLAGFVALNLLKPGHPLLFGNWPFVSDLRTGSFAGGGGEMALLMSGAAQLGKFYDLPTTVAAGMTSSKVPDAQSGWEKGYLSTLSGLAGANMIMMTMGGLADNVVYSPEALVLDEAMLSGVLRSVRGIEVSEQTIALDSIERAIHGSGHFLDDSLTLDLMETEFVYPSLADRQSVDAWQETGSQDIQARAREVMRRILNEHFPQHISETNDARIRDHLDILLPREQMQPGQ